MPKQALSATAIALIGRKVDEMFDRLKLRYLGPSGWQKADKRIFITTWSEPLLSLPGVFKQASALEGMRADPQTEETLVKLAEGFLNGAQERTKAQVLKAVTTFLTQAQTSGTETDVGTVLGGELSKVMGDLTRQVHTILDAETSNAKNIGLMDGITRINAHLGIEDPIVYFMVVHDGDLCKECKDVHLLEDGITPRVWYLSEVKQGYHVRGEDRPAVGGLHPHCRCTMGTLMPGYGFHGGAVTFISPNWNELRHQREA